MIIENYNEKKENNANLTIRSKIKRRCKVKTVSELYKDGSMFQKPKFLLSHFLQVDFQNETLPHELQIKDIETFGAFNQHEMKNIFSKSISRDSLQKIMIDALKLCYLYHPIMQAIQTELKSTKEQYKIKDILDLIYKGSFYKFLTFKTRTAKYLINNRNTEINIKTVVSGLFALIGNKLTVQNISDAALFYRLQEALYETAPNGLPFQFSKIIKAMKKIDRNITSQNFNKWQRKMIQTEQNIKFLQPHHFIYLICLSQPIKKKTNVFEIDKKQSKFQKQTQMLNVIKQKNNFIDQERKKSDWRDSIKVRGLSFQQKSKIQKIQFMQKEFVDIKKKIMSHKRSKSAHVTSKAIELVKQDLRKSNQKENQYLLDTFLDKSRFRKQNQRTLLKKRNKKLTQKIQFENKKRHEQHTFKTFYQNQLATHLSETPQNKDFINLTKPSFFLSQIDPNQSQKQYETDFESHQQRMSGFFHKNSRSFLQRNTSMGFKRQKPNLQRFKRIRNNNEV